MNPNEKVFTEKVLLLLIKYVRHFRAARKTFPKNLAFSNTLKYTHTQ
ncbi:rCG37466, partial [Rattus norvegicus]